MRVLDARLIGALAYTFTTTLLLLLCVAIASSRVGGACSGVRRYRRSDATPMAFTTDAQENSTPLAIRPYFAQKFTGEGELFTLTFTIHLYAL